MKNIRNMFFALVLGLMFVGDAGAMNAVARQEQAAQGHRQQVQQYRTSDRAGFCQGLVLMCGAFPLASLASYLSGEALDVIFDILTWPSTRLGNLIQKDSRLVGIFVAFLVTLGPLVAIAAIVTMFFLVVLFVFRLPVLLGSFGAGLWRSWTSLSQEKRDIIKNFIKAHWGKILALGAVPAVGVGLAYALNKRS